MHKSSPTVVVLEYDPEWPRRFEDLRARIWPAVAGVADRIEHVGSTSVPGLVAKPIIDMTIVVRQRADVPPAIDRLATLGYRHVGNLDIEDREAFEHPAGLPRHHLYVCPEGTIAIVNPIWEPELPLAELAPAPFPKLVVSGGHSAGFDAICDDLAERIGASRMVIEGAGHEIQFSGRPLNDALLALWGTASSRSARLSS